MQPSSPDSPMRIGIAIVEWNRHVLVGVRSENVALAGLHEFPGGKCFPDETPEACAIRECQEETGILVRVVEPLETTNYSYPHGCVELSFFLCHPETDSPEPDPAYRWVPLSRLGDLNFPAGNAGILSKLKEWGRIRESG